MTVSTTTHASTKLTNALHGLRRKAFADALAGVGASLLALWMLYPMDVYKTRIQGSNQHNPDHDNDGKTSEKHSSRQSLSSLFAGWPSKTLHTATSSFCYFYLYSWIVTFWKTTRTANNSNSHKINLSPLTRLVLSAIAAMLNTLVTLPLDGIASRQQANHPHTAANKNDNDNNNGNNNEICLSEIPTPSTDLFSDKERTLSTVATKHTTHSSAVRQLLSLYKGLIPSLLLCSNPAIHYTVFDSIKHVWLDSKRRSTKQVVGLSLAESFVLGLLAKFVATIITYPLIRAKVLLMVSSSSSTTLNDHRGLYQCLMELYRHPKTGGLKGLYQGCDLQLLHTLLKSALMMMIRERVIRTTRALLLPPQTTRPQSQSY